jgi:SET domain-containing protein
MLILSPPKGDSAMMRIPTYLAPSPIPGAGLGLFAAGPVAAGTLVWRFDPGRDLVLHDMPEDPLMRRFVEIYGYEPLDEPHRWILCGDDGRFINHADAPNTLDTPDTTVALRDIAAGEEITSDYRAFCRQPFLGWSAQPAPAGAARLTPAVQERLLATLAAVLAPAAMLSA